MKKLFDLFGNEKIPEFKKILRLMKLTAFFILISVFSVLAGKSYSQTKTLTIHMEKVKVKEALAEIENQSEFRIMYSGKFVDVEREVSLDVKNQKIGAVLDLLFAGTDVGYTVKDRFIVLVTPELMNEGAITVSQQRAVSGKVTDESGQPLPGVTIVIKGTTQGTVTNSDGEYSITSLPDDATLRFSFVGMRAQEVIVGNQTRINVEMVVDAIGIEEVVAIGYGTQVSGEITGAVSTLKAARIDNMAAIQSSEILRNLSGTRVLESNTPGGGASINIRGLGTINDNNPLWIVDGVPTEAAIVPNDIESISVLKDASTQAIYGARAANGVILVTTKAGRKNQKPTVKVNFKTGITKNVNQYNLLNTQEYGELLWLEQKNSGYTSFSDPQYGNGAEPVIPDYILPARGKEGSPNVDPSLYDDKMVHEDGDDTYMITRANKKGTNWMDEASRNAMYNEVSLDLVGGSKNTLYSFQTGFLQEEGILKWTDYKRFNLRSNITSDITEWLEIGEKVGVIYDMYGGIQTDNSEGGPISHTYRMPPIIPVYDIAGNYAGTMAPGTGNGKNPVFLLDSNKDDIRKAMNIVGSAYMNLKPFKGLNLKSLIGVNHRTGNQVDYTFVEKGQSERSTYSELSQSSNVALQWNWTNTIQYRNSFAAVHNITALLGTEAIDYSYNGFSAARSEFYLDDVDFMQLSSGLRGISNEGGGYSWSLFSIFGRINYNYDNKYLFEGAIRRDGSSRFSEENRYATFPAFSAGWRLTNEDFMSSTRDWLDELKIRVGYGLTGNDRIGNYNSYTSYDVNFSRSVYDIIGANQTMGKAGFLRQTFGSEDVKWETTKSSNLGIDMSIYRKLNFKLDLWHRITSDMLYPKQIPSILGEGTPASVNVGEMKNRGFDIELGYQNKALNGELSYNVDFFLSHYKNEIVKLTDGEEYMQGNSYRGNRFSRAMNGTSFPEFYGLVVEGIFQTQAEADAWPAAFEGYNKPGHFKYKDINGDGVVNSDDRTFIGSPHPDFTAGANLGVSYKGFHLTTNLFASYGNDMINGVNAWIDFKLFQGARSHDRLYNSWGSPYLTDNSKAKLPMSEMGDAIGRQPSSFFVEDASFLRMQNLTLAYDFNRVLGNDFFNSLRVYCRVTNVFTITNYSGLDPEVNSSGINMGIDAGSWPTPRRLMLGLTFGF